MSLRIEGDGELGPVGQGEVSENQTDKPSSPRNQVRPPRRRRWSVETVEESEEWVVSYMDMVTLIMCAFVVIAALLDVQSSHMLDHMSEQSVPEPQVAPGTPATALVAAQSSTEFETSGVAAGEPNPALSKPVVAPAKAEESGHAEAGLAEAGQIAAPVPTDALADAKTEATWRQAIMAQGLGDRVAIQAKGRTITMQIQDEILFPIGSGDLGAGGQTVIRQLTPLLAGTRGDIRVEGYTDNVPIDNERFPSNWELSATRATSVVRALIAAGISPSRLRATGYADTHPVQSNDTETGRAHNRRVSLVVER